MKKSFVIILIILLVMLVNTTFISATPPLPSPAADMTTISGIIPMRGNNLEITKNTFKVDILNANELLVQNNIERQAKVTITYEIYNPKEKIEVDFNLPFISNFLYLENGFEVKVNNNIIDTKLLLSDSLNFDSYYNLSDYLVDFQYDNFQEIMIRDYHFINDLDGYLYTVVNPETRGEQFKTESELTFYDVPIDTKFIDLGIYGSKLSGDITTSGKMYDSGEVDYFFVSEDLEVECITTEWEDRGNVGVSHGKLLEPAKITKEPIKLSEYIEKVHLVNYKGAYQSEFLNYLYKKVDEYSTYSNNFYLMSPYDRALNEYQLLALDFKVDFESQTKTFVEISYDTPIYCKYANSYNDSHMVLDFVSNPGNKWIEIEKPEILIIAKDKLINSPIPYEQDEFNYYFNIDDGSEKISITYINSHYYARNGCFRGCRSLSLNVAMGLGLFIFVIIFFRKNKII